MRNPLLENLTVTSPEAPALTAELRVEADDFAPRRREPATCGLPCPRGRVLDPALLILGDEQENIVPSQTRVLDRWPDGSIRWLLLDWQASLKGAAGYRLQMRAEERPALRPPVLTVVATEREIAVNTGRTRFELRVGDAFPFRTAVSLNGSPVECLFAARTEDGSEYLPIVNSLRVEEAGPLRVQVRAAGLCMSRDRQGAVPPLAEFEAYLHFFADSPTVRFSLTLRNPRQAEHPGGLWDLGNGGSIFFRDAALTFRLPPANEAATIRHSAEPGQPFEACRQTLEIYQDSSGGDNWRSSNHLNRHRQVPTTFRGYRLCADGKERTGRRATPIVALERGTDFLAVAMPYFWQNFPKAVEAAGDSITLRLFPRQFADVHEIQGGEQKTHDFYVAFGRDEVTDEPLTWCRAPLQARAAPTWYGDAFGPHLIPKADDPNADYLRLVDQAIEGDDTFPHKREVIDEYGWRHFGDIYGDHEGVFHRGPTPLVSHYNNQYDPVAGFAYQFLRSGDRRWHDALRELAAHVIDIDIYHCDRDKTAYNRGLFWHTVHYVDADSGTHRSYPKAGKVCGGGPSCEHNYTTGLMLHHFLTGDPRSRQTVIDSAQWVIDIDDGRRTVFRWLAGGATGLASSSGNPLYHGPGRGAGNSINALLDGHRLTGEPRFLAKAEELIRRCVHPCQDLDRLNLLDAERRWYYTVFLQALGKYLDHKAERGELDFMYAYGRATLLHYARWMADREYPYLDKPEILEYPTETWPAQDMRKSEVFDWAAKHATGAERERFRERAEFFFRYVTTTLAGMKTRSLCRPVVLLLSYGFLHGYFQRHPETAAPPPIREPLDFGRPEVFVPQKARALKRFKTLAAGLGLATIAGLAALVCWLAL